MINLLIGFGIGTFVGSVGGVFFLCLLQGGKGSTDHDLEQAIAIGTPLPDKEVPHPAESKGKSTTPLEPVFNEVEMRSGKLVEWGVTMDSRLLDTSKFKPHDTLHQHLGLQVRHAIPPEHVIVDREDWVWARRMIEERRKELWMRAGGN